MNLPTQPTITAISGRVFATYPAAVVVLIINAQEELLLLNNPKRPGWWEPVNGAVDAGETILAAALREVGEEAGADIRVRPLGVVHVSTFTYDPQITHVISITYLMAYEGGNVVPGDDMQDSQVRWASLAEMAHLNLIPPLDEPWLCQRALELYRLWRPQPDSPLQQPLPQTHKNKYDLT
ncbi:MAG: NUDIX hydrolase [Chloroflexi bacterium]|nr:NUDIX hydrolase [Chloroflexota bacterium]MBP8056754.1 NUDIX hydrolase [Chloroflexota bacterium]